MRTGVAVAVVVALCGSARADADDESSRGPDKGALGVGIILGEPTGITAKLYLKDDQAIQAAAGSAFISGGLSLTADYVFHPYILQSRESFVLPVYIGPGVRVIDYTNGRDSSTFALGARVVGGLLFDFKTVPLDAFIEVGAVLEYEFSKGANVRLNAGAGLRYYF